MTDDQNQNPYAHLEPVDLDAAQREDETKVFQRLSKMTDIQRAQAWKEEAAALGIGVGDLKDAYRKATATKDASVPVSPFADPDQWHEPVDGAGLLDALVSALRRFCSLPEFAPELIAAWILHAWAHDAADISPILLLTSPEKRCGKTTTLSVIGALVPRPLHSVNISTAVMFRVVEQHRPTMLVDEADTFLANNDDLRGILNGGHNRASAYVWRVEGDDRETTQFSVWAPKAIAMIGRAPETIEDRAIQVRLQRKTAGDRLESFRHRRVAEFAPLRQKLARWAADAIPQLTDVDPAIPDELNDRAKDNAEAICAIADLAGGNWPLRIRQALVGSAERERSDEPETGGVLLLRDLWDIFVVQSQDRLGTQRIIDELCKLDDAPWATWRKGQPINGQSLKRLLAPYGIKNGRDKYGSFYRRSDLEDAYRRYVVPEPSEKLPPLPPLSPCHPSDTEKPNEIKGRWQRWQGDRLSGGDRENCHPTDIDAELNAMFGEDER